MENWRAERDKPGSALTGTAGSRRGSGSSGAVNVDRGRRSHRSSRHSLGVGDFWDEDVMRARRLSDWENQKPMPAMLSSELVRVYSGQEVEELRKSLTALDIVEPTAQEPPGTSSDDYATGGGGGLNEATVTEQLAKEAALENRECFAEDVIRVWDEISQFITNHVQNGYGVQIPGLCTITIQEQKTPVVDTPYYKVRRSPLMILSSQVVHMYKLANFDEYTYNYQFPAVPLNLTEIAYKLQTPRRIIEGVVTEVLQAFARAVVCGKKVEFPFSNIGKLQVKDRVAKMRFYDEFCKKVGLDVPVPNVNPPKELIPDCIKEQQALTLPPATNDGEDNTLPGRMTPLRKHIPTETFRSVFHLREVRSVHDGALLVPVEVGTKQNGDARASPPEEDSENAVEVHGRNIEDRGETEVPGEDTHQEYHFLQNPDPDRIFAEVEAEGEKEEEQLGEFEQQFLATGRIKLEPLESESVRANEHLHHNSLAVGPHPHDMSYRSSQRKLSESQKKSSAFTEHGHRHYRDSDGQRHDSEPRRKSEYEAKPLYQRRSVSGKYEIDAINANPALFKETLKAHHYAITSKILGPEVVKKHLARRARLVTQPLSYDDKRFNPPSPK